MFKISIPTPCHEDWNKMTPDETGRHCCACAKSVVDFTGMSDEEVQHFFISKKEERVCGRFKQTQLQRIVIELPQNIFSIEMPLWKKFLAACLIVFSTTLFSCETKINDKVVTATEMKNFNLKQNNGQYYVGGMVLVFDSVPAPAKLCNVTVGDVMPEIIPDTAFNDIKGDVEIILAEEIKPKKTLRPDDPLLDKIFLGTPSIIIPKDSVLSKIVDSAKTKNPPKADSADCKTINNYY